VPISFSTPDLRTVEGGVSSFMLAADSVGSSEIQALAVTLAKLANLADQGVIGRGADGAGAVELLSPSADGQLFKRTGGVAGFSALDSTDWAPLIAAALSWAEMQTFAASKGIKLTPGTAPVAPVAGQLWHDSAADSLAFYTTGGKTRKLFEVGTFTAGIRPDTLGDWAPTYTSQLGVYVVIGPLMIVGFDVAGTTNAYTTGSGTIGIDGLPYGVYNNTAFNGFGGFTNVTGLDTASSSHDGWMPFGRANTTRVAFTRQAKAANPGGNASASTTQLPASRAFILRGMTLLGVSTGF
jgi:hypothetical protein